MSKRVVVTGGAGFIGSHLCDALLERGDTVTCVDNLVGTRGSRRNVAHLLGHPRFRLITENVLAFAANADLRGIDCIFNQAASKSVVAWRDPERDLVVNGLGALRLLLAAARQGVRRFVHASSGSVFGSTSGQQREGSPKAPLSLYGISKLAGENYCRVVGQSLGLDYTILRYYHVIGPRQDHSEAGGVLPIFVRRCLQRRPVTIYGSGAQTRSFTSVHDVVQANLLVAESEQASGKSFNCASGIAVSIQELADFVIAELGVLRTVEYAPARPDDIKHFDVDNGRLMALGVEFDTDWRAMAREVIAFERGLAADSLPRILIADI